MDDFEYAAPHTIEEALELLAAPGARGPAAEPSPALLAGGTDLVARMQEGLSAPQRVIDISHVGGLDGIDVSDAGLRLGALVRLADLADDARVRDRWPALAEACRLSASPQLRNMGTLGGNLLQASRCLYYRGPFECLLKGGDTCSARHGENREHALFGYADDGCVHVAPSDPAVALAAFGARVTVQGSAGEREIALADLYHIPKRDDRRAHTLAPDEILTAVHVPATATRSVYLKAMDRATWTFALASVAVALRLEGGRVHDPRVVLGGVAARPWRALTAEAALAGQALTPDVIARAAEAATAGARPLAHNAYKVRLVQGLVRKALREVVGER